MTTATEEAKTRLKLLIDEAMSRPASERDEMLTVITRFLMENPSINEHTDQPDSIESLRAPEVKYLLAWADRHQGYDVFERVVRCATGDQKKLRLPRLNNKKRGAKKGRKAKKSG